MTQPEQIFSERISSGNRTYFLDVRQSRTGARYLTIAESKKVAAGGYTRSAVIVFEDNIESFLDAIHKLTTRLAQA